ncbi:MAG: family 16 glycosylhydrolase [Lentisphaeria bacterium]|nr:family 16 glycosylhydrolase [Lentisphaeria bacterium]
MMSKKISLLVVLASVLAFGYEISLNGFFENLNPAGIPHGWVRNGWKGYEPACAVACFPMEGITGNVLRISDVQSENGAAVNTEFYPGRSGDSIRFNFLARGKGKARLRMYFKTVEGEWNFASPREFSFEPTAEWTRFSAMLPVLNGDNGETGAFDVSMETSQQGGELELADFHAELTEGVFRGENPFPQNWTLFCPMDANYEPTVEELAAIPEKLNGVAGRECRMDENCTLDWAKFMGAGEKKCGWAFAELEAPYACDYTIGAACDWWMQVFCNGECVIDTMASGNELYPYELDNHVATVRLRKGRNVFAVRQITGATSSVLKIGGPLNLGRRDVLIRLSKVDWQENFDGKEVSCTGEPEVIQGLPTPGLLAYTGQGVFRTAEHLSILPPEQFWAMPERPEVYRAMGVRIQNFGREECRSSHLSLCFLDKDAEAISLLVENRPGQPLKLQLLQGFEILCETEVQRGQLPADFLVGVNNRGLVSIRVTSLSDGSTVAMTGQLKNFMPRKETVLGMTFEADGDPAEVVLDNFTVGEAMVESKTSTVPFQVEPQPEFDPVKAGWKMVFEENFDGDSLDLTKWFYPFNSTKENVRIHDGVCQIFGDWDEARTGIRRVGKIATNQSFLYGYFEARVRFKSQPGWWTAFWLYGHNVRNPFYDGFEIDIYEDYYLHGNPGTQAPRVLDHNLHLQNGKTLKSYNYNSPKMGSLDDFYVIGCKWTPFEISYYLDGKLIKSSASHSPYNSVTFDAFNHGTGIVPLFVTLSGQETKSFAGDPKAGVFPDSFTADYVRVYEFPQEDIPQIHWTAKPDSTLASYGDTLEFSVEVAPNAATGKPVKDVYLFDSGYLLEHKSRPPYDFKVLLTKEAYEATNYCKPGRQGLVPDFAENFHAYSVFVQDAAGAVAHTDAFTLYGIVEAKDSLPYQGKAQGIPGVVRAELFDEGGQGVAYYDTSKGNTNAQRAKDGGFRPDEDVDTTGEVIGFVDMGEWVNYTVDVQKTGDYTVELLYGSDNRGEDMAVRLYVDGKDAAVLPIFRTGRWATDTISAGEIHLTEGRHVLKLFLGAALNFKSLTFKEK